MSVGKRFIPRGSKRKSTSKHELEHSNGFWAQWLVQCVLSPVVTASQPHNFSLLIESMCNVTLTHRRDPTFPHVCSHRSWPQALEVEGFELVFCGFVSSPCTSRGRACDALGRSYVPRVGLGLSPQGNRKRAKLDCILYRFGEQQQQQQTARRRFVSHESRFRGVKAQSRDIRQSYRRTIQNGRFSNALKAFW